MSVRSLQPHPTNTHFHQHSASSFASPLGFETIHHTGKHHEENILAQEHTSSEERLSNEVVESFWAQRGVAVCFATISSCVCPSAPPLITLQKLSLLRETPPWLAATYGQVPTDRGTCWPSHIP